MTIIVQITPADAAIMGLYAEVLAGLGVEHALVVRGEDGMDELTLCGTTVMIRVEGGEVFAPETVTPEDAGLARARPEALRGGDGAHNARLLEDVLGGGGGPLLDGTLLNAGAVLWIAGQAGGLRDGVELAREAVSSGKASGVLASLRRTK